jgi:hypothetical protein
MRKRIIIILMFLFSLSATPLFALDFILGAKAGYYVWIPYFKEMKGSGVEEIDRGAGILYGPIVSVLFTPDLSFSVALLTGRQSAYWSNMNTEKTFGGEDITSTGTFYAYMLRTDVDSALSYRVSERFKIIAGYKYQHVRTYLKATFREVRTDGEYLAQGDVRILTPSHGPALGLGFTQPLGDVFFAAVNLSGLYMWSKLDFERNQWDGYIPDGVKSFEFSPSQVQTKTLETRQIGLNLEPSFGANIQKNFLFTLGFRFQWVQTEFVDDPVIGGVKIAPDGWISDYIYGVFVSAMYLF